MNTTLDEAVALVQALQKELAGVQDRIAQVEQVVCPPFISLAAVGDTLRGSQIKVGAQNMFYEPKGAYTGEISGPMLKPLCTYVILGHSERRQYFGETDEIVNKKLKAALAVGLRPIVCVGENLEQNESGETEAVVSSQVLGSLGGIEEGQIGNIDR